MGERVKPRVIKPSMDLNKLTVITTYLIPSKLVSVTSLFLFFIQRRRN